MAKAPSSPTKVTPFSVRLDLATRKALEKAAKDDMRPASHLVHKILVEWLRENKYL